MTRIVIATGNSGKVAEIQQALATLDSNLELIPQTDLAISSVAETGLTYVENALIKARHAAQQSGLPAIADDSGLIIDALNGEPGLYTARYAGPNASMQQNIDKVLLAMAGKQNRRARCHCVMVYLKHPEDTMPLICQGTWELSILPAIQGELGFGYDPIFYVPSHDCSAAELSLAEKNRISHRGQALAQLLDYWKTKP